jgi:hypothetical protein
VLSGSARELCGLSRPQQRQRMFSGDLAYATRAFAVATMLQPSPGEAAAAEAPHWALEQILWDPDEMVRGSLRRVVHAARGCFVCMPPYRCSRLLLRCA